MLLFLDESYEEDEAGGYRFAYAGFAVEEQKYRGLVAAIYQVQEHGFAPGIALAGAMLEAMQDSDATVFGVLSHPKDIRDVLNPTVHLSEEHKRLLERVEQWMREQHPDKMVSVIPDTIDNYKHNLSKLLADYMFRSARGRAARHIVVTPFWLIPA